MHYGKLYRFFKAYRDLEGVESAMTLLPAMSAGSDFILHATGVMDSFNAVNLEKFIVDEDTISFCQRLVKGFEADESTLAADLEPVFTTRNSHPGGNFSAALPQKIAIGVSLMPLFCIARHLKLLAVMAFLCCEYRFLPLSCLY